MPFSEIHIGVQIHSKQGDKVLVSRRGDEEKVLVPKTWLRDDYIGEAKEIEKIEVIFFNNQYFFGSKLIKVDISDEEAFGVSKISITKQQFKEMTIENLLRSSKGTVIWNEESRNMIGNPSATFYLYMSSIDKNFGTPVQLHKTLEDHNYDFELNKKIYLMVSGRTPTSEENAWEDTPPLPRNLRM